MKTMSKLSALAFACLSLLCFSCTKPEEEEEPDKIVIPEAVDLGLSVKWASFDIGATKPGEPGYFFLGARRRRRTRSTIGAITLGATIPPDP